MKWHCLVSRTHQTPFPSVGLWGLVNNAGALADVEGPFEWQNVDDFQKV